jgi:hypothetical protein
MGELVQAILLVPCCFLAVGSVWEMLVGKGRGMRVGMRAGMVPDPWIDMLQCAFYFLFMKILGLWKFSVC